MSTDYPKANDTLDAPGVACLYLTPVIKKKIHPTTPCQETVSRLGAV